MRWSSRHRAVAVALVGLASACGDSTGPSPVARYVSSVTSGGLTAVEVGGALPAAGVFNQPQVFGPATVIPGGGMQVDLAAAGQSFDHVFIAITGQPGYYELTLPTTVTSVTVIIALSQSINDANFEFTFGLSAGAGVAYNTHGVTVVPVATGDVQVSVQWDVNSDVDLHVIEPGNEEIYYGHDSSATAGVLDLDSNPACAIDGVRNENITWPHNAPPHGQYTVRLDYYDECGESETRYVVTVRVKGHPIQTFTGSFTGAGDAGGAGSGSLITQFSY